MDLKYIIYQDLDGCITDFQGSSNKLFGEDFEPENPKIPLIHKQEKVQLIPTFWSHMPWMSDGRILWEYVHRHDPHILSAYSNWDYESCIIGKRNWIYTNLPTMSQDRIHLVNRKDKQLYARSNEPHISHILIDDYDKNIDEWRSVGGIAIHHTTASYTIEALQRLGL